MMKKIIAVLLLSLSLTAFSGCSSTENSDLENAFNNYTNWFESTFIENSDNADTEDNGDNIEEDDNVEVIAPESNVSNNYANFILDKVNITF